MNSIRTVTIAGAAAFAVAALVLGGYAGKSRREAARRRAVPDSVVLADSAYQKCHGGSYDAQMECYDAFLVPLVTSHGVRTAMGTLNTLGTKDAQIRADGHVYAHAIGIAAGRSGKDVGGTFASCTEIFQSGCYHGVIQSYFEGVHAVDTAAVNAMCASYTSPQSDQWLRFQCVHGMGHGLEMFYTHNLPHALDGCDLLREAWDRESCYGGAFMENIVHATTPEHSAHALHSHAEAHDHGPPFKALDSTDMQYPCSIMAQRYLVACYNMQTSVMLHFSRGNIQSAARNCLNAPATLRPVCFQSLGRDISAYSRQDHVEAIRMCAFAKPEYQPWCHVGVVKNFIDLTAKVEDGASYCRAVPGEANRLKCYEAVGEQIGTLRNSGADREAACMTIDEAYREACRFGARVSTTPPRARPS